MQCEVKKCEGKAVRRIKSGKAMCECCLAKYEAFNNDQRVRNFIHNPNK